MAANKNIYNMKLHDEISPDARERIKRVPGGWIYYFDNELSDGTWQTVGTFVKMNKEFNL